MARDYSKISPHFWTGETGRGIVQEGPECVAMAFYLMTNQHANMLGLYYLPIAYICEDLGMPFEGALDALQRVSTRGLVAYDKGSRTVFVPKMALYQVGAKLKESDNRVKAIQKEYDALPKSPFIKSFYELYSDSFHLQNTRPFEAPSDPLRSQEQEQEQEQEQDNNTSRTSGNPDPEPSGQQQLDAVEPPPQSEKPKANGVPYQDILALFHKTLPELRQVRVLSNERKAAIRARWNKEIKSIDSWGKYFNLVADSDFLCGRVEPGRGRDKPFQADIDWLLKKGNVIKIVEGKYANE